MEASRFQQILFFYYYFSLVFVITGLSGGGWLPVPKCGDPSSDDETAVWWTKRTLHRPSSWVGDPPTRIASRPVRNSLAD